MKKLPATTRLRCLVLLLTGLMQLGAGPNRYAPPSSNPENLHALGEYVYFSADDGIHGRELWRVDVSGNAELIRDITPGLEGTTLDNVCTFNGQLFFRVSDANRSGDLWRSDGTPGGTVLVRPFGSPTGDLGVSMIVRDPGTRLYFAVGDSKGTSTLWSTDGTTEGTSELRVGENAVPLMLEHYSGCTLDDIHYFGARLNRDFGVWRSDGTSAGTRLVKTFVSRPGAFFPLDIHRFVFAGDGGSTGEELWVSGGTPETTTLLKDIYPGQESSDIADCSRFNAASETPRVVFAATNPESGRELWETDGTSEGTRLRADVLPGAGTSSPSTLVDVGHSRYFVAVGDGIGKELWRYDVADDKFELSMDINSGISSSEPYSLCGVGGTLYFSALHPKSGEELWVVPDRASPPVLFADIYPGPESSFPYYTVSLKGRIVTVATGPVYGRELWIDDVFHKEMIPLVDINTDSSVNPSSFPDKMTAAGDILYFVANDIEHGNELWRTDGKRDGTLMVKDIFPGSPSSDPDGLTALGNLLYFTVDDGIHGAELWRSDGTPEGTSIVLDIHPNGAGKPRNLIAFRGMLFFSIFEPRQGEELWSLEPGAQPSILKDICEGEKSSFPEKFFVWKDFLYFQADDGVHGKELWRTDGTSDGTVMVRDIVDAPFQSVLFDSPREHGGILYFAADLDGRGTELWTLDESQTRLRLVRDIVSGDAYDVVRAAPENGPPSL